MDIRRLDDVLVRLVRGRSRRDVVQGFMAALAAISPLASAAGKKSRRRKKRRRQRRRAEALRQQCLDACGEGCNCFYDASGEILCAGNFEELCDEPCTSDDECATSNGCFAAVQIEGTATKERFSCEYSDGVCVNLGSC